MAGNTEFLMSGQSQCNNTILIFKNTQVLYESLQSGLENQKWGLKRFDGAPTLTTLQALICFCWSKIYEFRIILYH